MKKSNLLLIVLLSVASTPVLAQTYSAKVEKDSLNILNGQITQLKSKLKVLELKVQESKEEAEVEKLRVKLLKANESAKKSSENKNKSTKSNASAGSDIDLKAMEKINKKAQSDHEDAQKALDRFNKQVKKVETLRTQIGTEERKLDGKKPDIIFKY